MKYRWMVLAGAALALALAACEDSEGFPGGDSKSAAISEPGGDPGAKEEEGEIRLEACEVARLAYDTCRESAMEACAAATDELLACLEENGVEGAPNSFPDGSDPGDDVIGPDPETMPEACREITERLNACGAACLDEYVERNEACLDHAPCLEPDDAPGWSWGEGSGGAGGDDPGDPPDLPTRCDTPEEPCSHSGGSAGEDD